MATATPTPTEALARVRATLTDNADAILDFLAPHVANLASKPEWDLDDNFAVTEGLMELVARFDLPAPIDGSESDDDEAVAFWDAAANN